MSPPHSRSGLDPPGLPWLSPGLRGCRGLLRLAVFLLPLGAAAAAQLPPQYSHSPSLSPNPSPSPSPVSCVDCVDLPGWTDKNGTTCEEYEANQFCNPDGSYGLGWGTTWGTFADSANTAGIDATEACCACSKPRCTDIAGWKDSEGDTCATYKARDYCTTAGGYGNGWAFGTFANYADQNGLDATEACCACGRGGTPPIPDVCGLDYLYEYSYQQRCRVSTGCETDASLCSSRARSLSLFRLDTCTSPCDAGYLVAVSYAPRPDVTNKACLVLDLGPAILVLTVPHRAGHGGNCAAYCDRWCRSCVHVDLIDRGLEPNATVEVAAPLLRVTYTWDPVCNSTDRYAIASLPLKSVGLPSFTANETCGPGTQVNTYTSPSPRRANLCVSPSPTGPHYCSPSPSPVSASRSPLVSPSPSPSASLSPSPSPSLSPSPSPSLSPSQSPSPSPSRSPSPSPSPSASPSPSRSPSPSPSASPSPSSSPSLSPSPSPSLSPSPSPSLSPSSSPSPSLSPSPSPSQSPSASPIWSPSPSPSPSPSFSPAGHISIFSPNPSPSPPSPSVSFRPSPSSIIKNPCIFVWGNWSDCNCSVGFRIRFKIAAPSTVLLPECEGNETEPCNATCGCPCCDQCNFEPTCPTCSCPSVPNCTVTFAGLTATFETDVGRPTDLVVLTAFLTIRTVVVTFDIANSLDWYLENISLWAGGDISTVPKIGGQVDQSLFLHAGPNLHQLTWTFPHVYFVECPGDVNLTLISFVSIRSTSGQVKHLQLASPYRRYNATYVTAPLNCTCGCTEWSSWSPCTQPCDGGEQQRVRRCFPDGGEDGGDDQAGVEREKRPCNTLPCGSPSPSPVPFSPSPSPVCIWTPWSPWSSCSDRCGGQQTRRRDCVFPGNQISAANETETRGCVTEPVCDTNNFFEYANQSCCGIGTCEREPDDLCFDCQTPNYDLFVYLLGQCKPSDQYNLAISYSGDANVTGKTCLLIQRNHSILVLTVPHRRGPNVDCSLYCTVWCLSCSHIDLTSQLVGDGASTTFQMGKGKEKVVFTLVHTYDPNCSSIDRYTITGGPVDHFSLPSFDGDGRCTPGYPPNREHLCFNSSTATELDTRQGVAVGTLQVAEDGVNLFVTYNVTPYVLKTIALWVSPNPPPSDSTGPLTSQFSLNLQSVNGAWSASTFTLASLKVACATYPPPYLLYIAAFATVTNTSNPAAPPLEVWAAGSYVIGNSWATAFIVQLNCNCTTPPSPQCGTNALVELTRAALCQPLSTCELESAACSPAGYGPYGFPLHSFQLRNCSHAPPSGYQLALSRDPSSDSNPVTGKTCLLLEVNHTLLVLMVPHRQGKALDCSQYCGAFCLNASCQYFDLTDQGQNATFHFSNTTFHLTSAPSPQCGTTDLYTLSGGDVQQISVPTFTADPTCAPGTDPSYGGKQFVCSDGVSSDWPTAQAAAHSLGGQLATLRTPYEYFRLTGVCCVAYLSSDSLIWLGGRRDPVDHSWQWQPGHLAEGLGWDYFGSPQQGPPGDCLAIGGGGKWYGVNCSVSQEYLLEVPSGPAGLVSFTGPAEVCLTAPEARGLSCLWRYVLHNDDLEPHRFAVTSSAEFLNITFGAERRGYLDLFPCQSVEVCVGLAAPPGNSQTITLKFAVDTVVRDTRNVTLDLLPTPIVGTDTDPGTATLCDIYESSSSPYLELRATEADPFNLFVSMTAVDANDTSRVYGSANTRRLLLSSGVWQNVSEVDLLVLVKYRLASNNSATCSKTRRCTVHIVDVPSGASGYFLLEGVSPGDVLYPGQSYVAHIFGFVGTNLSYSMWGYCSENPAAPFRLSPDSANPQTAILVPPHNDNCTLLLFSQAEDPTGAVATSVGVWYNVSADVPADQTAALRAILDRSIGSLDDVLALLPGLALLPAGEATPLLPAFLANLTEFTASLPAPADFLRQVAPSLYFHVLHVTGATIDYFLSIAQWFTQLTAGLPLPYAVAQAVARVITALMGRISGLAAGGGVVSGAAKFVVQATSQSQEVLATLRALLVNSVLPAVVLFTPRGTVGCESGGETAADRCFAVCTLTDTPAGHLSRGAISATAVADPAGKRVVAWRNVNKPWLADGSVSPLLPALTAITSVEIYSKCNPVGGYGDPLARFAVLDGTTGRAATLPIAVNALRIPILNTTAQACYQLNVTTGEFKPQLATSDLSCLASGFVWAAAVYSPTQRDASDPNATSCGNAAASSELVYIVPTVVLGTLVLLCGGFLAWLFVPPREVVLRLGPATVRIGRGRPSEDCRRSPPSPASSRRSSGDQRPGDSPARRRPSSGGNAAVADILVMDRAKEPAEPWAVGTPAPPSPAPSRLATAHARLTHAEGVPLPPKWDSTAALGRGLTLSAPSMEPDSPDPLVPSPEALAAPRPACWADPPGSPPLTPLRMSPPGASDETLAMDGSPAPSSGPPSPDGPQQAADPAPTGDVPTMPLPLPTIPNESPSPAPDLRRRSLELGAFMPEAADHLLEADNDAGSLAGDPCDPLDMISPLGAMAMPHPEDVLSPHATARPPPAA